MAHLQRLSIWLSPWENISNADDLVRAVSAARLPGHFTEVLIPTVYIDWPQSVLRNNLGPSLKVDSPDHAAHVRATIEAQGLWCGGWSVPGGTGDAYAEGRLHGSFASAFDHFNLNWEEGWQDFWAREGRAPVDEFLGGYWDELASRGKMPLTGITFVPNTAMLGAATPDETAAWVEGSHYVAIETYLPGDPGLDPTFGKARMVHELSQAGHPDFPIVNLLEFGDLPALAAQHSHRDFGVQVWTVGAVMGHVWPDPEPQPDPEPEPEPVPVPDPGSCQDPEWHARKDEIVGLAGELALTGDQIIAEGNRKNGPRKTYILPLGQGVKQRAERILNG